LVELDDTARRVLGRRHPEMSGYGSALVVASADDVRPWIVDALERVVDAINAGDTLDVDDLVDKLSAKTGNAPAPILEGARREAQFRVRLMQDYVAHRAAEVAMLGGSTASNRSQLAYRWRKERRIFAVPYRGELRYLGFQFDHDGQPVPVVAQVLAALTGWSEWQIAAWFVTANGLLDKEQPVAVLLTRAADVVSAAEEDARRAARLTG
jgi:hypothetical protein